MALIPIENYQHHGPLVNTTTPHHVMQQLHSRFANDIISEYPFGSMTKSHNINNSYNGHEPVVRNIKIQLEEEECEPECDVKVHVTECVDDESANKKEDNGSQSLESIEKSYKDSILPISQPILGKGRKAILLDLWAMNETSLKIRNWMVKSEFDVTTIIGNYQKGVSCGYIAAQAACIFRKLFTKEIEDEPLRPLIFSKCLDPNLIKTSNEVLEIDDTEAVSLDMVQIYSVILSLMGGNDDLSWLTVTTWNAFLEGMTEGHQSSEFSVWIINTADTESSLREDYDDRGDHWFTVVLWP